MHRIIAKYTTETVFHSAFVDVLVNFATKTGNP